MLFPVDFTERWMGSAARRRRQGMRSLTTAVIILPVLTSSTASGTVSKNTRCPAKTVRSKFHPSILEMRMTWTLFVGFTYSQLIWVCWRENWYPVEVLSMVISSEFTERCSFSMLSLCQQFVLHIKKCLRSLSCKFLKQTSGWKTLKLKHSNEF